MHCRAVKQRLVAWRDAELSPGESVRVQEHLKGCASCRELDARLVAVTPAPFAVLPPLSADAERSLARALDETEVDCAPEPWLPALDWSALTPHMAWAAIVLMCLGWGASRHATATALQAKLDARSAPPETVLDGSGFREASWSPGEGQSATGNKPEPR